MLTAICGACDGSGETGYIGSRPRPCLVCKGLGELSLDAEAEAVDAAERAYEWREAAEERL